MATPEETRQARLDALKAEREKRLADAAKARAEADPMRNPTVRPEAPAADGENVYYYGWVGGASSGQWKLYKTPVNSPQAATAEQRSQGGTTQASFNSAVGANTLKTTASTTPPSTDGTNVQPGTLPAGFTAGAFPAELEGLFGSSAGYLGYRIVTNADGSQSLQVATGPGSYQTFGAKFTTDKSGKYVPFSSTKTSVNAAAGDGSTTGNTATAGLTQADVDAAIAKALTAQQAKFDALAAQQKAEAEAAKLSLKVKASDKLSAMFAAYGLESLAPFISSRIMADVSEEMLLLELYDRPEYQQRFPGMKDLRAKKRTITEGEYMKIEKEMTQTARFFDLPVGFYDNPSDFGKLIANEVSAKEYQDRLQVGQDLARTLNPVVKNQLLDFYGVGEGQLTAYVLDPEKALSLIKKQAQAARFVGFGRGAGFQLQGITAGQAENIAGTESYAKLSEQQLAQALGQAGQLRATQSRLAGIEGQAYNEQEALKAVIEGSPEALLASQQRAQREGARFGARSGITGASLRSTTAI